MKTDLLIKAMAKDATIARNLVPGRTCAAVGISLLVLGAVFVLRLGFRPDLVTREAQLATTIKLTFTISLSMASLFLLLQEAVPGKRNSRSLLLLLLPLVILLLESAFEFWSYGLGGWQDRLIGSNGLQCLAFIPALASVPLVGLIAVLRAGAPIRPGLAGMLAGVAATGIASTFYALSCPDDSPLFVAFWYGIAIGVVAIVGMLAGRVFSRW